MFVNVTAAAELSPTTTTTTTGLRLSGFVRDYQGEPVPEKYKPIWISWSKRQ